ncbi:large conductance mechanosensitive channel [Sphingomonas jejuensis]|uniref:Large-conductance mechanosensitive channel n=1 Tax=Sphingomonas jejuensis TaxID=904715 RepID=A0ABX0XLQ0_9SPHN|nr:large conductance mechanosensitive channel protein MscL [Sphingomonas jejuensis]NJC34293.1 large conductance mechanosensitive channel [Sphingomonas jejuensis]
MFKDFKAFIARGNVLDLAVAVIIGAAFGRIVTSLTDDIIMPVIGKITGDLDFSNYFVRLGELPAGYAGSPTNYAALKAAGVPLLGYGQFVTVLVNFLIVAVVIFMIVRAVNRLTELEKRKAAEAPAPSDPADVILLREIRDELRARRTADGAAVPPPGGSFPA